jgi:DNA-binding MarR family transcriptional regulator
VPEDEVDRLRNQVKALYRRMRREQPAIEGMSITELQVLTTAARSRTAMRPGQLGDELQMTSPNVAAALRSLEKMGMVSRRRDPEDKRQIFVDVTECGHKVADESAQSRRVWLRETVDRVLTDEERVLLFKAGDLLQRLADDVYANRGPEPRRSA